MKHHGKIKIKHAVKVLKVSRSGFYEYMHRRPSKQQVEREILSEKIKAVFHEHKGRYGAVRITKVLHNTGIMTNIGSYDRTIAFLMLMEDCFYLLSDNFFIH